MPINHNFLVDIAIFDVGKPHSKMYRCASRSLVALLQESAGWLLIHSVSHWPQISRKQRARAVITILIARGFRIVLAGIRCGVRVRTSVPSGARAIETFETRKDKSRVRTYSMILYYCCVGCDGDARHTNYHHTAASHSLPLSRRWSSKTLLLKGRVQTSVDDGGDHGAAADFDRLIFLSRIVGKRHNNIMCVRVCMCMHRRR